VNLITFILAENIDNNPATYTIIFFRYCEDAAIERIRKELLLIMQNINLADMVQLMITVSPSP
jgi:hypothetical protein